MQEVSLQAYACQQLKYIEPFGNIKQSNRKSASAQQKVCQSAAAQLAKAMASDKSRFVTPYSSWTASSIMAAIIENIKIETTLGYCGFANPAQVARRLRMMILATTKKSRGLTTRTSLVSPTCFQLGPKPTKE
jgi:hypothetical protein